MPRTRNIMLVIAYQGTAYCGWQIQPNGLTIQECVESAIGKLTGNRPNVLCAGRTDSGVHALGQVASFRTDSSIPAAQFRRGIQRFVPDDIAIVSSREVAPEFHATYSAVRKRYRYLLFDGPVLPPFLKNLVYRPRSSVDVDAMRAALPDLLGTHDFRCFESHFPNKATSVRTVMEASISRLPLADVWNPPHRWQPADARVHPDPGAPLLSFEIMADGFLYNMVRAIVGTLLRIGTGQRPVEYLRDVIASQDRGLAGSTAAAEGLYLVHVDYPPELLLPPQPSGG
ncbi:MAG: tRNA pseudouridine(38-40) synthase TruA [Planctomycetaceae bacterium]